MRRITAGCAMFLCCAVATLKGVTMDGDLRCAIRGHEDAPRVYFSAERAAHLHFLLFSGRDGLRVYQELNSWGYSTRSFTAWAINDASRRSTAPAYQITRIPMAWTENAPRVHLLRRDEPLITDI